MRTSSGAMVSITNNYFNDDGTFKELEATYYQKQMLLPLITTHCKLDGGAAEKNGFLPYTVHNIQFSE